MMFMPCRDRFVRLAIGACAGLSLMGSIASPLAADELSSLAVGRWYSAAQGGTLPAEMTFDNALGKLGILNAAGPIDTAGHPFFEPVGANGRACVTCHQPAFGMSVSVEGLRERWQATEGKDPAFAAIDGSNHPDLPQELTSSHSLLLNRGLFRIPLPWPPRTLDGTPIRAEFTIEIVRDPTGCNTDPAIGLAGANPTISVFRRPRPVANLKYVPAAGARFNIKTEWH
jgi:hypothetical protein